MQYIDICIFVISYLLSPIKSNLRLNKNKTDIGAFIGDSLNKYLLAWYVYNMLHARI